MDDRKNDGLLRSKAFPPFAALRAFEAVGRKGGIRAAGLALSLDHAVVSRHIRMLENWLGVPLFQRANGQVVLTDVGARYHTQISAAMVTLASATADILGDSEQRRIQVWCVPGFAAQWLSDQLAEFQTLFPQFEVELRPTDIAANLILHEADVDIRYYGDDWPPQIGGKGLRHVELARPLVMPVASPEVAARLSAMPTAADLISGPLLHEEHDEQWRAWLQRNGVTVAGTLGGALLWHAHLALAAARRGQGVALANRYLVDADLKAGRLVEVDIVGTRAVAIGAYVLVTREERWRLPAIVALRSHLAKRATF